MFLSARAEYACLAMIELAARYDDQEPARITDLADRHDIPHRFLMQILLQLKGAGLVASTRGAAGGYQLARRPVDISLSDVLAVTEPVDSPKERATIPSATTHELHSVWKRLADAREKILTQATLADLVPTASGGDYVI